VLDSLPTQQLELVKDERTPGNGEQGLRRPIRQGSQPGSQATGEYRHGQ
jgi:hypothetical protein